MGVVVFIQTAQDDEISNKSLLIQKLGRTTVVCNIKSFVSWLSSIRGLGFGSSPSILYPHFDLPEKEVAHTKLGTFVWSPESPSIPAACPGKR